MAGPAPPFAGRHRGPTAGPPPRSSIPGPRRRAALQVAAAARCRPRWRPPRTRASGRRRRRTRTSTTCSRSSLLGTAASARPRSSSATPTTPSRPPSSAPWASTSRSRRCTATTNASSCRSGTQRARSGTAPSPQRTTAAPWASSSCTTSPTRSPSTPCRTGPPRSRPTPGTTRRCCSWGTSVTWRMRGWCPQSGAGSWPTTLGSNSLRPAPRTTSMSSRLSSGWWMSSARRCPSRWMRLTRRSRAPSRALSSASSRHPRTRTAPAEPARPQPPSLFMAGTPGLCTPTAAPDLIPPPLL